MASNEFMVMLSNNKISNPAGNVLDGIWESYERIVLHSLVTAFGLDFLVRDQHGGDVDTILGVRESGTFKSEEHRVSYENRGAYDSAAYHGDQRYREITKNARKAFDERGEMIEDAYVPGNTLAPRRVSSLGPGRRANLDHVVSAHEIHEDPGRILAGLDGVELANSPENLRYTNESLNKSKSDLTVEEFIDKKGDELPDDVKQQMREVDREARDSITAKMEQAYYTSADFWTDTVAAAGARGIEMGLRQAMGFVFVEVWFSCRKELFAVPDNGEIGDYYNAIVRGVEKGIGDVIAKRKGLLESFGAGFVAGALASFTTTLCNIFLELDQNTIRNLRQAYASIVQAGNVLLFNPNDLLLGDRIEAATVILGTGAGVLAGNTVGDLIAKTPIGADPTIGKPVCIFCSTLVSGLISCTLLLCLDRSKFINKTITALNMYMTDDQSFRQLAADFAVYAAQIADIDVEQFCWEANRFQNIADDINAALDEDDLHDILENAFDEMHIDTPWTGDFDSFMADPNNKLVFG